jgi:nicotinamide-nucleotide amidase
MPSVEVIAVGTELLLGQLVDTNSTVVAQRLAEIGLDVRATHCIGDNRERIAALVVQRLESVDGAITTGGLGPTVDDLTKEAVCDALGLGVELYEPAVRQMEAFFALSGREMRPNNRKQAEIPLGSHPLDNPHGTAPGFVAFRADGKFVACMPGVPREMRPMLDERLIPYLRDRFATDQTIHTRVIHTVNIGESEIDHRIEDLFRNAENPKIAVLAHDYRADVKVMAKAGSALEAEAMIAPLQAEIEARLREFVFGEDGTTLESAILGRLESHGRSIALAESCTGGRIAAALTSVPGASKSFIGGIVAYADAVKIAELGVDPALLQRVGAVSGEVAVAMARGVRARLGADVALATTGIAGPTGGTPEKPVGLVWFAFDDGTGRGRSWRVRFRGGREAIQRRATTAGLGLIWKQLESNA